MNRIALLIALSLSVLAFEVRAEVLGSAGTSLSYELESNGRSYATIQPWSVRAGYGHRLGDLYFEYSQSESTQGTTFVQVGKLRQEFIVFAKRVLATRWALRPFVAAGPGLHIDTVSTQLGSSNRQDAGQAEPLFAAVGGLQLRPSKNVEINFEGRAAASPSYEPNPQFSAGLFFGFRI